MSIKNKMLACFFTIMVLNLILLLIYYRFVLAQDVTVTVDEAQARLDGRAETVAEQIQKSSGTPLEVVMNEVTQPLDSGVVIDIETKDVVYGNEKRDGKISFYGTAIAEYEGRKLLVKLYRQYNIRDLKSVVVVKKLLIAETVIVVVLMLILGFVIHYIYVRPLMLLNQKMASYRKNKKTDKAKVSRNDELGQMEIEFYRLVRTVEEEKQLQNRIIASISHDVKTPLTSVMGYVERLRSGKIADQAKVEKYLQTIYGRAQDIKDIIGEFDEYLSSSTESNPVNWKELRTEFLCNLLEEEYIEELSLKGIGFEVGNHCRNCSVLVDLPKIRRVFGNIIGNALRYVGTVSAQIRVTCEMPGEWILFRIEDNGPGVPEHELERIFEAFYTRDSSRGSGSGLGLSICKSIVEAHKGAIYAQSSVLGGLAIVIVLPPTQ